ncbi:MAG: ATP-binding protein, partial [Candidatus Rokuibacteriota bacterium]
GLGLSISRRIVSEHGGAIEVTSTRGEGTCFRVTLPAQEESGAP